MYAGLLPIKPLFLAKSRLAAYGDDRRRAIARALAEDALDLCARSDFLEWRVLTSDPAIRDLVNGLGIALLDDPGDGLNAALRAAVRSVADDGADAVVIVPSDVPLARPDDLLDVIDTGATSDVVVVPSATDGGTNALMLSPPTVTRPRFGPGSLEAHVRAAAQAGLRCSILDRDRLALDLDTVEDVTRFLEEPGALGTKTGPLLARFLESSAPGTD